MTGEPLQEALHLPVSATGANAEEIALRLADVSARLARFDQTNDPDDLWPGLDERSRVASVREIGRLTKLVLSGAHAERIQLDSEGGAYAFGVAAHLTGMGPLLGRWAEEGRITGDAEALARLAEHLAHGRMRAARMAHEVWPALDALLGIDIVPVVLKGFHTGRVYFEEPGVRRMADVDLLIPADRVDAAEAALRGAGFTPRGEAHRPYKRDWIGAGVDPRHYSVEYIDARSAWTIELHASLDRVYHPGAVASLDRVRALVDAIDIDGREVRVLSPPLLLVMLACHCSQELEGSRLLRLVELARVARGYADAPPVDWDVVVSLLQRTNAARYAYPALALVEELSPGSIDDRVLTLGRRESTWAARHTVAHLAPAGGSLDARGFLRQSMWTRGGIALANRVARSLWPVSPEGGVAGWRIRLRRWRRGLLSLGAPDERTKR